MTQKENINISAGILALLSPILNENSSAEQVANTAIHFCHSILKDYPDIKDTVDSMIGNYDSGDSDFNSLWNREIAWIKHVKENKL